MIDFDKQFTEYRQAFEKVLNEFCSNLDCKPQILSDSLKYSLQLGGKRVRPVLMLAVGDLLGIESGKLLNFALALELIHTYSLIHDDLPEMDNDDYRRGKPSNHKVFGIGNAILAGDGLLNTAYSILLGECFKGDNYISAAKYICDCAGINGMISGQSADLLHENDETVDLDTLGFIYENKTSKLIMAALAVPSILCGGRYFSELKFLGKELGFLFQYTDDILDVEVSFENVGKSLGKDSEEGKYTSVRLYGLDGSKVTSDFICANCIKILEGIDGDTDFLKKFAYYVRQRTH